MSMAKAYPVSGILCFDEVMIDRGSHVVHINATKKPMPVSIVCLCLPQLYHTSFLSRSRSIYRVMNPQHFLMLVIDFWVAHEKVPPEAAAHKLKDVFTVLFF